MKQKYKVFINDQEIVFVDKKEGTNSFDRLKGILNNVYDFYQHTIHNQKISKLEIESPNPEKSLTDFIENFKIIEAAGGIVRKKVIEDEILMIYRLGKWDLPKGKIEVNELPEIAAVREVEEECGIHGLRIVSKLENTYHLYELKGKPVVKLTHWYLMTTNDNRKLTPQKEEGIEKAEWIPMNNLDQVLPYAYSSISSLLRNSIL